MFVIRANYFHPYLYITRCDKHGSYTLGVPSRAKLWKTSLGALHAEARIRKLHSDTLSAGALDVHERPEQEKIV